jgi:regulatory protein
MRARKSSEKPQPSLKATAIRMLARRDYGRAELRERLAARGAAREEVDGVLDELERLGYLSDARFAHAVVAQKTGRFGRRAIAHALKEKRVAPAAAAEALRALDAVDELAQATALWQRRFGQPPRDDREMARQMRFLLARGYSTSLALKVLRAARAAGNDADAEFGQG